MQDEPQVAKLNDAQKSNVVPERDSPVQVSDTTIQEESPIAGGKRPVIIEDEQTGSVTVSYGDELVRVELNDSSGDEFSDVEETEEQRILRESGAQIIEDDDDDEDEIHPINIQLENKARQSVIHPPVERNAAEINRSQHDEETGKEETLASKSNDVTQKKKVSKLEQSIRKISNIREKENNNESVQLETVGSISAVVHSGNRTDMTLVVKHNIRAKEPPPSFVTAREAATTLIESGEIYNSNRKTRTLVFF